MYDSSELHVTGSFSIRNPPPFTQLRNQCDTNIHFTLSYSSCVKIREVKDNVFLRDLKMCTDIIIVVFSIQRVVQINFESDCLETQLLKHISRVPLF